MDNTIGKNIKLLRKKQGLTQEMLAEYLEINREEVNYYENGKRDIPSKLVTKIAELFAIDEYDLFEENEALIQTNVAFAFRAENIKSEDLKAIASFKKIAMNYLKMYKALKNE